jgi:hypothetical protein
MRRTLVRRLMSGLPVRNGAGATGVGFRCEIVECASRDPSPVLRLSPQMATGLTCAGLSEACTAFFLAASVP